MDIEKLGNQILDKLESIDSHLATLRGEDGGNPNRHTQEITNKTEPIEETTKTQSQETTNKTEVNQEDPFPNP